MLLLQYISIKICLQFIFEKTDSMNGTDEWGWNTKIRILNAENYGRDEKPWLYKG